MNAEQPNQNPYGNRHPWQAGPGPEDVRVAGAPGAGVPGASGAPGAPGAAPGGYGGWPPPPRPGDPYLPARTGWSVRRKIAAAGAVVALALGAGSVGALAAVELAGAEAGTSSPTAVSGVGTGATVAQVAAAVQPSVVSVETRAQAGEGGGSGVILRSDGTILTNAHVVQNSDQITVRFSDGRTAPATVLGADRSKDVAVIRASGVSGLKPATLGNSGSLAVGDTVLAVGSPLGLEGSVTSGIVSALGREIQEGGQQPDSQLPPYLRERVSAQQSTVIKNAIQTDAAINPGNSGGALVNGSGQVIGVSTAILTSGSGSGNIGLGFAIPINDAKRAADSIIAGDGL
ncbi:hypothetical protein GCM10010191_45300 [Actinomadura vinacea]|uniref:Trypsin-like serine protease n=1 Tax=Actinomadura vinacea TaxID=115336 RepID=A0ABP5WHH1_9ACTN